MKKVFIYIPNLNNSGPQNVMLNIASGLREKYNTVIIVNNIYKLNHTFDGEIINLKSKYRYPVIRLIKYISKHQNITLLATQDCIITAAFAKLILKHKNIKLISRPANHITCNYNELIKKNKYKHNISKIVYIESLKLSDKIIAQSDDIKKDLRKYNINEDIRVIPNPVKEKKIIIKPEYSTRRLNIISVGRLSYQKGYDILIKAVSNLSLEDKSRIFVEIYGIGELEGELKQLIIDKNLEDIVMLRGFYHCLDQVYRSSDYFISSSRYEGFPNVVLEALSYGIPIIATNCPGGTKEMVEDGINGYLCEDVSSLSLKKNIEKALSGHIKKSVSISKNTQKKYNIKSIVNKYKNYIEYEI